MIFEYINWGIFSLSAMILIILLFFVKTDDNKINIVTLFWIGVLILMNIIMPIVAVSDTKINLKLFKQGKTLVKFGTRRGEDDYIISKNKGWTIKNNLYFVNDVFIVKASRCDLLK